MKRVVVMLVLAALVLNGCALALDRALDPIMDSIYGEESSDSSQDKAEKGKK